jgi:hypothetical protein
LPTSVYSILFFGGHLSAQYRYVWVCSNGFVSFEDNSTSALPQHMPDHGKPNAIIAALWTDLIVDGSSSITYGKANTYFVISWNNVLQKKTNKRQTFQIIIEESSGSRQCDIYISWKSINASGFSYGIENQEGSKGNGEYSAGYASEQRITHRFYQNSNYAVVKRLTINFDENDDYATLFLFNDPYFIRGYNLHHTIPESEEDPLLSFLLALSGPAALLATKSGIIAFVVIGTVARYVLIPWTVVDLLIKFARLFTSHVEVLDMRDSYPHHGDPPKPPLPQGAYITVIPEDDAVDAALGIANVLWRFQDDNNHDHALKITAKLNYAVYDKDTGALICEDNVKTSVDLSVVRDAGNDRAHARYVTPSVYLAYVDDPYDKDDYYNVTVPAKKWVEALMTPLGPADLVNFDLYLYNPNGVLVFSSNKSGNQIEYVCYYAGSTGIYSIRVNAPPGGGRGLYTLDIRISTSPPGGCPFVSVWNGTTYVLDNNLLAASEVSNRADVDDYYKLEQTLVPKRESKQFSWYSLQICEFENEHSYIDQVKLVAVDHESDTHVAVSPFGEILTYKNPHSPILCLDNEGNDMLEILTLIDDNYYQGYAGNYLLLDFGDLDISSGAKLVLRADQDPIPKCPCIHVQVQNEAGEWTNITTICPRVYWATEIIDLSAYLPNPNGNLKIRLYFTAPHKLDYVGLDTTPQANITIRPSLMTSAIHSEKGSVLHELRLNDEVYAELLPSQQIQLTYMAPRKASEARTFILYTNGHYYTIKENP